MKKSKIQSPKSKVFGKNKSQISDFKSKPENQRPKIEQSRNIIFGLLPILESLRANSRRIEKILIADGGREHRISEIIDLAKQNHVTFQKVPRENLSKFV